MKGIREMTQANYQVNDMTCGHCVQTITKAVQQVDPKATVTVDLPTHRVQVDAPSAGEAAIKAAIEDAGYTPVAA